MRVTGDPGMRLLILVGVAVALSTVGCGTGDVRRGSVVGSVTFDSKPLDEGKIRFFPLGEGIGSDSDIVAGAYEVPPERGLSAGAYRVEISHLKASGRKVPNPDGEDGAVMDEIIETIPSNYNRDSTLVIDYDPADGESRFDFSLDP